MPNSSVDNEENKGALLDTWDFFSSGKKYFVSEVNLRPGTGYRVLGPGGKTVSRTFASKDEAEAEAAKYNSGKKKSTETSMATLTRYLVKTVKGYVTKDNGVYADKDDDAKQFDDPAEAQGKADEESTKTDGTNNATTAEVEPVEVDAPADGDDKDAYVPKPSAKHAAMLYQNAKDEDEYITHALKDMDHPGMSQDLSKYRDSHVTPRMEHLTELLHKHHGEEGDDPSKTMDKVIKGMETDEAGTAEETGEAQLVDGGQIPAEGADDADPDTEEINERYQDPETKKWFTATVGTVRRGLNGRLYIVKEWSPAARAADAGRSHAQGGGAPSPKKPSLEQSEIAHSRKALDDDDMEAVKDASDYMSEASEDDQVPHGHRSAMKSHGKRLGQVHKALTNMGKVQRDGGRGTTLTDEGTAGNKGSMTDKGETQTDHGTPSGKISYEGGDADVLQLKSWEKDMVDSMEQLRVEKEETRKVAHWTGLIP